MAGLKSSHRVLIDTVTEMMDPDFKAGFVSDYLRSDPSSFFEERLLTEASSIPAEERPAKETAWSRAGRQVREAELRRTHDALMHFIAERSIRIPLPEEGYTTKWRVAYYLHELDTRGILVAIGGSDEHKLKLCNQWTPRDTQSLLAAMRENTFWSPAPREGMDRERPKIKDYSVDKLWIDEAESMLKPASEHSPEVELNELVEREVMVSDPNYGAF